MSLLKVLVLYELAISYEFVQSDSYENEICR